MRLLNLIVAAALVLAAGYVYKSKFAATVEAERVAKLRAEIVRERDLIAALRAKSAKLEAPARIEGLAQRHLALRPLDLNQIDTIDAIPFPPMDLIAPPRDEPDIANARSAHPDLATGTVRTPTPARRPASPPATGRPAARAAVTREPPAPIAANKPAPRQNVTAPDARSAPLRPLADEWTESEPATAGPR